MSKSSIDSALQEIWISTSGCRIDCEEIAKTKSLFLKWVEGLVGEEEEVKINANPPYTHRRSTYQQGYARNQLRREILKKAEEELG